MTPISSKKMSLEGDIFLIRLLEIVLTEDIISRESKLRWPQSLETADMSRVDGVLALYDVTKRASIALLPSLLSEW